MKFKILAVVAAAVLGQAAPVLAEVQAPGPIVVVQALYLRQGSEARDVSERVTDTCGPKSQHCEFYCADSSFGGLHGITGKKICRIVYQCGDGAVTKAVQANSEERIVLHCLAPRQ